jgi:anaerobic selenocysteine-containing dehydrogenase
MRHRDRTPRAEILSIARSGDVLSRGHICPKAIALKDVHEDPDRLRRPMRRSATGWEEISWAVAFDEVERRIAAVRDQHGRDAVAIYAGNPTVHNLGAMLGIGDFIRAVGTRNLYSATSVDQLPHMVASHAMFGHQFLIPVPDVDRPGCCLHHATRASAGRSWELPVGTYRGAARGEGGSS